MPRAAAQDICTSRTPTFSPAKQPASRRLFKYLHQQARPLLLLLGPLRHSPTLPSSVHLLAICRAPQRGNLHTFIHTQACRAGLQRVRFRQDELPGKQAVGAPVVISGIPDLGSGPWCGSHVRGGYVSVPAICEKVEDMVFRVYFVCALGFGAGDCRVVG